MYRRSIYLVGIVFAAAFVFVLLQSSPAYATLKWYYDPLSGNVAFDSSETRSGGIYNYYFTLYDAPFNFRSENHIGLGGLTFSSTPTGIGQTNLSERWSGLYTIGNVMPTGMSESWWQTTFSHSFFPDAPEIYGYIDVIGGGTPPDAQFIYGPPSGEFKNKWDLVDPNTLTWATTAKLVYNPGTGEVMIDTTGPTSGYISSLRLLSGGSFLPDGFTPFVDVPISGASTTNIHLFANAIEPGIYSLGNILPAGLTSNGFASSFTSAQFLGLAGFNGHSFDFQTYGQAFQLQFATVPEPAAITFFAMALVIASFGRGRRAR